MAYNKSKKGKADRNKGSGSEKSNNRKTLENYLKKKDGK